MFLAGSLVASELEERGVGVISGLVADTSKFDSFAGTFGDRASPATDRPAIPREKIVAMQLAVTIRADIDLNMLKIIDSSCKFGSLTMAKMLPQLIENNTCLIFHSNPWSKYFVSHDT
jgi:hypothetical protein